jgi:hypothetical protein
MKHLSETAFEEATDATSQQLAPIVDALKGKESRHCGGPRLLQASLD